MRAAALALLILSGCTSAAERAYRDQVECLAQYPEGEVRPGPPGSEMPERTAAVITAERDGFPARAIENGRALGKSPADITADARAYYNQIVGPDAHGSEERMEALADRCQALLAG